MHTNPVLEGHGDVIIRHNENRLCFHLTLNDLSHISCPHSTCFCRQIFMSTGTLQTTYYANDRRFKVMLKYIYINKRFKKSQWGIHPLSSSPLRTPLTTVTNTTSAKYNGGTYRFLLMTLIFFFFLLVKFSCLYYFKCTRIFKIVPHGIAKAWHL